MSDLTELARQVFETQPFSTFIGAKLVEAGPGTVTLSLTLAEHLKQQHGFAHGGVLSYLADNALTFAGGLAMGGNAVTSEFKINYIKPAVGSELIARAVAKSTGKRQAVCQCEIFVLNEGNETLCALAQGTIVSA